MKPVADNSNEEAVCLFGAALTSRWIYWIDLAYFSPARCQPVQGVMRLWDGPALNVNEDLQASAAAAAALVFLLLFDSYNY